MFNINSVYFLMFTSGFLGGFGHCIGMCGPIVASYCMAVKSRGLLAHLLFNYGRVTTYTILGGIMGVTGSFLSTVSHIQQFQKGIMIFAGVAIIMMGLGLAGWLPLGWVSGRRNQTLSAPTSFFINKMRRIFSGELPSGAFYPMGLATGLIPCGLVYTALITAARAAMEAPNPLMGGLKGMLMMFLFGLGTLPALVMFAKIVNVISIKMRSRLYKLAAVVMIAMGIVFLVRVGNL
ncbi:MAG: sulfite exporter TauE/SafE family protein [Desulfobacteraceae bacterium]|jgi:sulfite exporter TauE/SafE